MTTKEKKIRLIYIGKNIENIDRLKSYSDEYQLFITDNTLNASAIMKHKAVDAILFEHNNNLDKITDDKFSIVNQGNRKEKKNIHSKRYKHHYLFH